MGRVGDEGTFVLERAAQLLEQTVECADQRLHLLRQASDREWLERPRPARGDRARERAQRLERAPHDPPDEEREHRHQDHEGQQCAQREPGGTRLAHRQCLAHLDHVTARNDAEDSPPPVLALGGHEAEGRNTRQPHIRARHVHALAVERPDLHHEVVRGHFLRQARRGREAVGLVAEQQRRLAQVGIEKGVRLEQRVAVDDRAARDPDQQHRAKQPGEQRCAQRPHPRGSNR